MNSLIKRACNPKILTQINTRSILTNAEIVQNCEKLQNRNPRSLELLRIARKPTGYHLEQPGREYWHKLFLTESGRHVTAEIRHFENGTVLSASTSEWSIKQQLYRPKDGAAYLNLGRVMAQRCLESGILAVRCDLDPSKCEKVKLFLVEVEKGGVALQEPSRYIHANPWDCFRYQKPWEVED